VNSYKNPSQLKILLLNNYDSFTFNIASLLIKLFNKNTPISAFKKFKPYPYWRYESNKILLDICYNDLIDLNRVKNYDIIVISSGPYSPKKSGLSLKVAEKFIGKKPLLGICLGHQVIGSILGFSIKKSTKIVHGAKTTITHFKFPYWKNVPQKISVARYNSLILATQKNRLKKYISSISENNEIMSIESQNEKFLGLQFHPDSFLSSKHSHTIIKNFILMNT
jgi:para-aminobenzoate synthetase component 2